MVTFRAGQRLTATALNLVADPPLFVAYQNTQQNISTSTWTALNWYTEIEDTSGMHDNNTNSERMTPTVAGLYECYSMIAFGLNATGVRAGQFRLNGAQIDGYAPMVSLNSAGTGTNQETIYHVHARLRVNGTTDYIEVHAWQNSGGTLATARTGSERFSFVALRRIGP